MVKQLEKISEVVSTVEGKIPADVKPVTINKKWFPEYALCESYNTKELVGEVNSMILAGWMPFGGVQIYTEGRGGKTAYLQAVINWDDPCGRNYGN